MNRNTTTNRTLTGIQEITDGTVIIENGNISNVKTLTAETIEVDTINMSYSTIEGLNTISMNVSETLTAQNANIQNLNAEEATINEITVTDVLISPDATITNLTSTNTTSTNATITNLTAPNATITTLSNTKITSDEGNFNKLKVDTLEALNFQINALSLEVMKMKKTLTNRTVTYTSVNEHLMANKFRAKQAEMQTITLNDYGMSNMIPPGTFLHSYSKAFFTYPTWILCDGRWLKVSEFPNLYTVIGNTYGYRTTNGYPEFKLFQSQGLFLRSYQGPYTNGTNMYFNGWTPGNKAPQDGPQLDNMRDHWHSSTVLYDEAFQSNAMIGGTKALLSNIRNGTSGSLNQTVVSTTYEDNLGRNGGANAETHPMYIGAYLFIKS